MLLIQFYGFISLKSEFSCFKNVQLFCATLKSSMLFKILKSTLYLDSKIYFKLIICTYVWNRIINSVVPITDVWVVLVKKKKNTDN